jgi:hypothetical protein
MCDLTASASVVDHLGFRRAAVYYEGSGQPRDDVRAGQTDEIGIFVGSLVVAQSVGARRSRALRYDDDEAGRCSG